MCDRTQEFLQLINKNDGIYSGNTSRFKKIEVPKTKTAFNEAASEIARGIHKTSSLLNKLTNLVRRQGLFDDPTDEINSLIFRIKQDLDDLNSKCDSAQLYVEGKKSMFGDVNQSSAHNVKVVSHLKTDLMNTTKGFKSVLEMRSSKMKDQQMRKVDLVGKGMLSPMRSIEAAQHSHSKEGNHVVTGQRTAGIAVGDSTGNQALTKPNRGFKMASPYAQNHGLIRDKQSTFGALEAQQQQQLLLDPIAETQYFDAREKAVTEVERTIGELGTLFKRLSTMIAEQQELVERVDEDIESATSNANRAKDALMKAYEKVSSNKGMYLKISAIVVLFILFFTLFLM